CLLCAALWGSSTNCMVVERRAKLYFDLYFREGRSHLFSAGKRIWHMHKGGMFSIPAIRRAHPTPAAQQTDHRHPKTLSEAVYRSSIAEARRHLHWSASQKLQSRACDSALCEVV